MASIFETTQSFKPISEPIFNTTQPLNSHNPSPPISFEGGVAEHSLNATLSETIRSKALVVEVELA